ncbi:MAG: DUF349 domain-containing protein [Nannocystaceae bacterium]
MSLADLFRPKWKHSRVAVRAEALRTLGTEQRDVLIDMARNDRDEGIRQLAVDRLDDPELLTEIACAETSESVCRVAAERATHLWMARATAGGDKDGAAAALAHLTEPDQLVLVVHRAKSAAIRTAAFERIDGSRDLAELAKQSKVAEIRVQAVRRIRDPGVLQRLAMSADAKDLACAAVDGLDHLATLETVAATAKSKNVRNRAKKRLTGLVPPEPVDARTGLTAGQMRRAEQARLVAFVETAIVEQAWRRAHEVAAAKRDWGQFHTVEHQIGRRFAYATERFERERDTYRKADEKADSERTRAETVRREALARAKLAAAGRLEREAEGTPSERERRIEEATAQRGRSTEEVMAEREATTEEATTEPCAAAESGPGRGAKDVRRGGAATEATAASSRSRRSPEVELRAAPKLKRDPEELRREEASNLEMLRQTCSEVEAAVGTEDIDVAEAVLKRAAAAVERPGRLPDRGAHDEVSARYEHARTKLFARVRELVETEKWREWSNLAKQESLLVQATELLALGDEAKDLAGTLKALQGDWKTVRTRPGRKGDQLWRRFRATCDEIYEKVKLRRRQEEEVFKTNLAHKEALCVRVESLQESSDWGETAALIKALQADWKGIGMVPRRAEHKVWSRFRGACDLFFERRKRASESYQQGLAENLAKKETLIRKVELLVESVEDDVSWKAAKDETKRLQRGWREIGHVPRKVADPLYKRFRRACDRVFSCMEVLEARREAERIEELNLERDHIRSTLARADLAPDELLKIWGAVHQVGVDDLVTQARQVCAAQLQADRAAFAGTELDPANGMRRKRKLCEKLEASRPGEDAASLPLAERITSALASNALGTAGGDGPAKLSELRAAKDAWRRIGPTPGDEGRKLDLRFESVCASHGGGDP